jgi:hypothetical protein
VTLGITTVEYDPRELAWHAANCIQRTQTASSLDAQSIANCLSLGADGRLSRFFFRLELVMRTITGTTWTCTDKINPRASSDLITVVCVSEIRGISSPI